MIETPRPAAGQPVCPTTSAEPTATVLALDAAQHETLTRLVMDGCPHEVCGLLVGRLVDETVVVERVTQARNLNVERARDRFVLDPADFLAADRAARADRFEIVGIWHSHPDHPARPSMTDLEAAWEGYSYLIIPVTRGGVGDFRSWRLVDGRFREEQVMLKKNEKRSDGRSNPNEEESCS